MSNPLKLKPQTNGTPRLQGVFRMRDEHGFPVDMAFEIAKENKWDIDWVEAMADALRQCVLKYDALVAEMKMLEPSRADAALFVFKSGIMGCEGETICDRAEHLYRKMHA